MDTRVTGNRLAAMARTWPQRRLPAESFIGVVAMEADGQSSPQPSAGRAGAAGLAWMDRLGGASVLDERSNFRARHSGRDSVISELSSKPLEVPWRQHLIISSRTAKRNFGQAYSRWLPFRMKLISVSMQYGGPMCGC